MGNLSHYSFILKWLKHFLVHFFIFYTFGLLQNALNSHAYDSEKYVKNLFAKLTYKLKITKLTSVPFHKKHLIIIIWKRWFFFYYFTLYLIETIETRLNFFSKNNTFIFVKNCIDFKMTCVRIFRRFWVKS